MKILLVAAELSPKQLESLELVCKVELREEHYRVQEVEERLRLFLPEYDALFAVFREKLADKGSLVREKNNSGRAPANHFWSTGAHVIIRPSFHSAKSKGAPIAASPPRMALAAGRLFKSLLGSLSPHLHVIKNQPLITSLLTIV